MGQGLQRVRGGREFLGQQPRPGTVEPGPPRGLSSEPNELRRDWGTGLCGHLGPRGLLTLGS